MSTLIDNTAGFTLTEGLLDFVISGNSGMYDSIVSNAVDGVEYAYKAKFADGVTAGYESGKGVYSSATSSIARTTIFTSSNSGAKVDFAAGQKFVALVTDKETIENLAATALLPLSNTWTGNNTFTAGLQSTGAGAGSFRAGSSAGATTQGVNAVAVGESAGHTGQLDGAVALGYCSGCDTQGSFSVAIGYNAGTTAMGSQSVAIGNNAGYTGQGNNGIIISAKGIAVDDGTDGHIHIASDDGSIDFTTAGGWTVTEATTTEVIFTKEALQAVVAASTDFADFKTKVAAL